jgi:hypothetical protein
VLVPPDQGLHEVGMLFAQVQGQHPLSLCLEGRRTEFRTLKQSMGGLLLYHLLCSRVNVVQCSDMLRRFVASLLLV